jgi:hypothetical protein
MASLIGGDLSGVCVEDLQLVAGCLHLQFLKIPARCTAICTTISFELRPVMTVSSEANTLWGIVTRYARTAVRALNWCVGYVISLG